MIPSHTSTPPPPCWRLRRTGALCPLPIQPRAHPSDPSRLTLISSVHKTLEKSNLRKISLEIFLGPVLMFQLVCLVQWWSFFSLSYLGHVSEYCTPCAFGHSSDVAALKYGKTGGKWHLGNCTLDFSQFAGSYFAPWFFHTLLATLLTILNVTLDCLMITLQKLGNFKSAVSHCKISHYV